MALGKLHPHCVNCAHMGSSPHAHSGGNNPRFHPPLTLGRYVFFKGATRTDFASHDLVSPCGLRDPFCPWFPLTPFTLLGQWGDDIPTGSLPFFSPFQEIAPLRFGQWFLASVALPCASGRGVPATRSVLRLFGFQGALHSLA